VWIRFGPHAKEKRQVQEHRPACTQSRAKGCVAESYSTPNVSGKSGLQLAALKDENIKIIRLSDRN